MRSKRSTHEVQCASHIEMSWLITFFMSILYFVCNFFEEYAQSSPAWKPVKNSAMTSLSAKKTTPSGTPATRSDSVTSRDASASPRKTSDPSVSWSRKNVLGESSKENVQVSCVNASLLDSRV